MGRTPISAGQLTQSSLRNALSLSPCLAEGCFSVLAVVAWLAVTGDRLAIFRLREPPRMSGSACCDGGGLRERRPYPAPLAPATRLSPGKYRATVKNRRESLRLFTLMTLL